MFLDKRLGDRGRGRGCDDRPVYIATDCHVARLNKVSNLGNSISYRYKHVAVSFVPKQETNDFRTSNSVFSSVELEIRAIISFKVVSWYEITFIKC